MKYSDRSGTGPRRNRSQERDRLTVPEMCRLRVEASNSYTILNVGKSPFNEILPKAERRCSVRDTKPQKTEPQKWSHNLTPGKMLAEHVPLSTVPNRWTMWTQTNNKITLQGKPAPKFPSQNKTTESHKVMPVRLPENVSNGQVKNGGAQSLNAKNGRTPGNVQKTLTQENDMKTLMLENDLKTMMPEIVASQQSVDTKPLNAKKNPTPGNYQKILMPRNDQKTLTHEIDQQIPMPGIDGKSLLPGMKQDQQSAGIQPLNVKKPLTPAIVQNQGTTGSIKLLLTKAECTINIATAEKPTSIEEMYIPTPPEKPKEQKTGKIFKRKYKQNKQKRESNLMTDTPSEQLDDMNVQGQLIKGSQKTDNSDHYNQSSKPKLDKRQAFPEIWNPSEALDRTQEKRKLTDDLPEVDTSDHYNPSSMSSGPKLVLPEIPCNDKMTDVEAFATMVKIRRPHAPNTHEIYDTITIDTSKSIKANKEVMGLLKPILPNIHDNRRKQDKTNFNTTTKKTEAKQMPQDNLPDVYKTYARQNKRR